MRARDDGQARQPLVGPPGGLVANHRRDRVAGVPVVVELHDLDRRALRQRLPGEQRRPLDPLPRLEAFAGPRDDGVGHIQHGALRAVVLRQRQRLGVGPDALEPRERPVVRPAELVDRLVVVAHHHQIGAVLRRRQRPHELDLRQVHILELVHHETPVLVPADRPHPIVRRQQTRRQRHQVVDGQPPPLAAGPLEQGVQPRVGAEASPLLALGGVGDLVDPAPVGSQALLQARRPQVREARARLRPEGVVAEEVHRLNRLVEQGVNAERDQRAVDPVPGDQLAEQPAPLGAVDDLGGRPDAGQVREPPEQAQPEAVEGVGVDAVGRRRTDEGGEPLAQLRGGLVGEGDGDNRGRVDPPLADHVGDPVGNDPGLAGSRAREDDQRRAGVEHAATLGVIQAGQKVAGVLHAAIVRAGVPRTRSAHTGPESESPSGEAVPTRRA